MLDTEKNTVAMSNRIYRAACLALGIDAIQLHMVFEHGQHWVTQLGTGAQWSAIDAEGLGSVDGFTFEQVTEADEG